MAVQQFSIMESLTINKDFAAKYKKKKEVEELSKRM